MEHQGKREETIKLSLILISIAVAGIMAIGIYGAGYKTGSYVGQKEKDTIEKRAYQNGYKHARMRFDNPPSNLKAYEKKRASRQDRR